ncbi:NUDIX hydrolase [Deinococcus detaillensis]|uniref:NUDIX hydrolase n=1 Tax=Deinococcus detaillensis TaxID=2592048 RepID=A0A553US94_9DEIO|nr:NUDIX hydrolase [Deinococcus detaillensis]TSA83098.1 NUDIX hydrolase [Deinococcus detaillensis]
MINPSGLPLRLGAGAVILRDEWLAVVREADGSLTFPKGGIESGEDPLTALRREVNEEAGLTDFEVLAELGVWERENFARTRWVQNRFFLCRTNQTNGQPLEIGYSLEWHPFTQPPALFWADQLEVLEAAQAWLVVHG